jgi:uncharacterized membrane protein YccC
MGNVMGLTTDDRLIFARLPLLVEAHYRHSDIRDALRTRSMLGTCGSVVEAVGLEEWAAQMQEHR